MREEFDNWTPQAISPTTGVVLLVGIAVALAAVLLVLLSGLNPDTSASAGVVIKDSGSSGVQMTLGSVQTADRINIVVNGTTVHTWNQSEVGTTVTVTGVAKGDTVTIIGVVDGDKTVLQTHTVNADSNPEQTPHLVGASTPSNGSATLKDPAPVRWTWNWKGPYESTNSTSDLMLINETSNALPGDAGTSTFNVTNTGDETGNVTLSILEIRSDENGLTDAENDTNDTTVGTGNGELLKYFRTNISVQDPNGTIRTYLIGSDSSQVYLENISESDKAPSFAVDPNETIHLHVDWTFDSSAGNDAQSDTLIFNGSVTLGG